MKILMRIVFLGTVGALAVGCSYLGAASTTGNAINIAEIRHINPDAAMQKNGASIRINDYTDTRMVDNPRKIGTGAMYVSGLRGQDIMLDQDVATIVTGAMMQRLDEAGFPVSAEPPSSALFELSGVVKELSYNVKARDEISISLETTLKEIRSGKIVWSGIVVEKNERFAGVSGNNKQDVADYLRKALDIVTAKTTEAIRASLIASHPELFNLNAASKTIPGVTVLVAPAAAAPASEIVAPVVDAATIPAHKPLTNATNGLLLIYTLPVRAKVYLNSVYYGLSPLHLELAAGVYNVNVKLEGYKMAIEKVSVRAGDSTEMELNLER